jgi:CTP:phosphocholine cytidylyltransferase-like protein|tara:strand:+ start:55 stop:792 length:738 start_codon:yes stop_codon:yes gene_type:complete
MRNVTDFITSPRDSKVKFDLAKHYSIILFTESHGYRMKNHGAVQLTKINGTCLIDHQIKAIKSRFKNFNIILSCGFESSRIWRHIKNKYRKLDITLIENPLYRTTNSCESVRLALMNTNAKNILICSSSNIFEKKHLDQLSFSSTSIFCQRSQNNKMDLKVYKGNNNHTKLDFGVGDLSWTEMLYLEGEKAVNDLYNIIDCEEYKSKFLFEAINKLSARHSVRVYENKHKEIIKLDSALKLKEIN